MMDYWIASALSKEKKVTRYYVSFLLSNRPRESLSKRDNNEMPVLSKKK
jgi:hypothetical protein